MTKNILAFEVSNTNCSVSISTGYNILAYEEDLEPFTQAEKLILLIEKALQSINYNYKDINYLAFTNGPGSFTGIRVGLATAEGITLSSNKIKCLVISNFDIYHYILLQQKKDFDKAVILLNAYRDQMYYQEFFSKEKKGQHGIINKNEIFTLFSDRKEKIVCISNHDNGIFDKIEKTYNISMVICSTKINAIQVCKYANKKINERKFSKEIKPFYIKLPNIKNK